MPRARCRRSTATRAASWRSRPTTTYDSAGRLTSLVYEQGTTILASYTYSYAGADPRSSGLKRPDRLDLVPLAAQRRDAARQQHARDRYGRAGPGGLARGARRQRDLAGRLGGLFLRCPRPAYRGQLTRALPAQPNESYSYDANGNRTSSTSSAAVVIGADNELLFDGTYTYTYDADGNARRSSST